MGLAGYEESVKYLQSSDMINIQSGTGFRDVAFYLGGKLCIFVALWLPQFEVVIVCESKAKSQPTY